MKNCNNKNNLSIYIHIPFCKSKCYYCNFFSCNKNEKFIKRYFTYLKKEIKNNAILYKDFNIDTIYIGGGTPSIVNSEYIVQIINYLKKYYNILNNAEISIECNPNSVDLNKLIDYKKCGINRISFGVQSLNNKQLKSIGRAHNKKQAINAIKIAKQVGFKNISADILLGLPHQNKFNLKIQLNKLIIIGVTHLSCYMLILEQNTKLFEMVKNKKIKFLSEDKSVDIYNFVYNYLKNKNFYRYEISNFALNNFECKHNFGYWSNKYYIGFGASAHSYFNNKRFCNPDNFDDYYNQIKLTHNNYLSEYLSKEQIIEEYIMLSLRTTNGIDLNKLNKLGCDLLNQKKSEIDFLIKNNFMGINKNNLFILPDKFGLTNQIILKLI